MTPMQSAILLRYIRPETGSFMQSLEPYVMKMALPVQVAGVLPLVPDGTVKGQRYIPANVAVTAVGDYEQIYKQYAKMLAVAGGAGVVVGGVLVWLLKRTRR